MFAPLDLGTALKCIARTDEIAARSPWGADRRKRAPRASPAFLAGSGARGRGATGDSTRIYGPIEHPSGSSQPSGKEQHNEDDYDYADDADASMTVAIAISSKASTEPAKQEYHEYDDEYESDGHDVSP
jgi:hypothetical protein